MITTYNQRLYPNPFRYRRLKNIINQDEVFDEVNKTIKPFLTNKFYEIEYYLDELDTCKSEIKLFRLLREKILKVIKEKIKEKYNVIDRKVSFLTRYLNNIIDDQINLEIYQKNLRYLELPLQPLVNKNGFEIQTLYGEVIGDMLEDIEYEYGFIYDYSSNLLPDPIDLWEEYALFNPTKFPYISHDDILESTYEIWETIFQDLQKKYINRFKWVVTGDIDNTLLKVITPTFRLITKKQVLQLLESFLSATMLLILLKCCILILQQLLILKRTEYSEFTISNIYNHIKEEISFKKFRITQKTTKLFLKVDKIRYKVKLNYNLLKLVFNKILV